MGKRFDWVELDRQVMLAARKRLGLSREAVARQLQMSAKTYERYEQQGRVPRHEVPRLAAVLHLEIETAEPARLLALPAREPGEDDFSAAVLAALSRLEDRLGAIERRLDEFQGGEDVGEEGNGQR